LIQADHYPGTNMKIPENSSWHYSCCSYQYHTYQQCKNKMH